MALTGQQKSTLGRFADVSLDCSVAQEACPLNLVPTASTTAALAMGDALAVTLQVDQATRTRFVQLVTSDPLMVYRLELGEAKALAKELADCAHAGERGAR